MNADRVYGAGGGRRRHASRLALLAVPLLFTACDWFTTFEDQPRIEPWETEFQSDTIPWLMGDTLAFRGNPQMSVPITGMTMPGFIVSYGSLPGVIDSMAGLRNPVLPDARSLENGRKYYAINCMVCHGPGGTGNGPATRYGIFPIPIVGEGTRAHTDGYIWGIIRNGRGSMPPYNRIEEMDRWDVVNYVRGLQGMLAAPVDTGALALPGVGGRAVPGFTEAAPTRPVPYRTTTPPGSGISDPSRIGVPGPTPSTPSTPTTPAADTAGRAGEGQR